MNKKPCGCDEKYPFVETLDRLDTHSCINCGFCIQLSDDEKIKYKILSFEDSQKYKIDEFEKILDLRSECGIGKLNQEFIYAWYHHCIFKNKLITLDEFSALIRNNVENKRAWWHGTNENEN